MNTIKAAAALGAAALAIGMISACGSPPPEAPPEYTPTASVTETVPPPDETPTTDAGPTFPEPGTVASFFAVTTLPTIEGHIKRVDGGYKGTVSVEYGTIVKGLSYTEIPVECQQANVSQPGLGLPVHPDPTSDVFAVLPITITATMDKTKGLAWPDGSQVYVSTATNGDPAKRPSFCGTPDDVTVFTGPGSHAGSTFTPSSLSTRFLAVWETSITPDNPKGSADYNPQDIAAVVGDQTTECLDQPSGQCTFPYNG